MKEILRQGEASSNIPISIIVPCYKVEEYLPRCIDSLTSQTLNNVELIFINDGSPDKCLEILKEHQQKCPSNFIIVNKSNEGVWQARLDGIEVASGEYIGFLDGDDYAEQEFCECLYEAAKKSDADIAVCGFKRVDILTEKTLSVEMCPTRNDFFIKDNPGRLIALNTAPWNKCFKAEYLQNLQVLSTPPIVFEDVCLHLLTYEKMKEKVVFVPKSLVNYVVHENSGINTVKESHVECIYSSFKEIKRFYTIERPDLTDALCAIAFLHLGISLPYRLINSGNKVLDEYFKRFDEFMNKEFPNWKHCKFLGSAYSKETGGAFKKLHIAKLVYEAHLMKPFLKTYDWFINHFGKDIKW